MDNELAKIVMRYANEGKSPIKQVEEEEKKEVRVEVEEQAAGVDQEGNQF